MKNLRLIGALVALSIAAVSSAAVTGQWRVNLLRGSTTLTTITASSQSDAWNACLMRASQQPPSSSVYTCQTLRYVVTVTADPPPPPVPVDCVVSAWDPWVPGAWGACTNGQQTRTETRQRLIVTPASNGGQSCPALTETRTISQACTVTPPPPPPPAGSGTPLSMLPGSYPVWIAGGARHENIPGAAWDGSPVARIWPPTSEQTYGGIGGWTVPGRSAALRFEMRAGPTYASGGQGFVDNKFIIFHTVNGNRPMLNIQPAGAGCLQLAIAQGTVKQFNQRAVGGNPAGWFRGEGNEVFRWCDTASRAGDVAAGQWLTVSVHITCGAELHSSGSIRAAVWSRTGKLADWWIPWTYDSNARCTDITRLEGIGDYYNGRGNGAAGTWFDLAAVTIVPNSPLLTPRAGFLQ